MAAMMRSLSSCLEVTRMWRMTDLDRIISGGLIEFVGPCVDDRILVEVVHGSHDAILEFLFGGDTDVANDGSGKLGKKALHEVEPGAVFWRESKFETADGLTGEPGSGLLGDVGGMIVEDQLDCRMGLIGGIEKLEEFDELAAAMAILDQGVNLAGEQIDAGQQADRAMTLVFMIAREGRMGAGLGRQIRRRRGNRLDAGLFVIRDDRHRIALLLLGCCRGLLNDLHLAVNTQNLRHLLLEFGIAALQVVAHFVRLHFLLVEDLAHRTLHQLAETGVPFRRSMLARMPSQQPTSSTVRADSPVPSPCGRPTTPARPWPQQ